MTGRVAGKVAFITGAARGQGRAHAVRLAEEGADVIAVDVDAGIENVPYPLATAEDMAETVRQVEALDRRIVARTCDVRDLERMRSVVAEGVAELGGRLDIVSANAGVAVLGPWREITPEILRTTIDINLIGVWNTVMASLPPMLAAGRGGSIVLTSSAYGIKPCPFAMAYNVSKAGVTALAKSFAQELAKDGVRVNSVHPGGVDTDMNSALSAPGGPMEKIDAENPNLFGMLTQWIPGVMQPEDVSNAVLYLASDESKWVTGHALAVDGGLTQY